MRYNLIITPAAQQDIEDALSYYLNIRLSLGEHFIDTIEVLCEKLKEKPHHYSFFGNQKRIRAVSLTTFPYLIVFQIEADSVYIFGLHNTHQNPETILKRF